MIRLIDTSSFSVLVRYYLPFDRYGRLREFITSEYENGGILVLDKVAEESKYFQKRAIVKAFPWLESKGKGSNIIKTDDLIPNKRFFNLLENQFCNQAIRSGKNITLEEFENEKTRFLNTADAKLLLYSLDNKAVSPLVITEETKFANDGKVFHKIPHCCDSVQIDHCDLPKLIKEHYGIELGDVFVQ